MLEKRALSLCTLLASLALPSLARADMEPSFSLPELAWSAEAVVVATEGAAIDGALTVLSSLRGPLAAGTSVHLRRLAAFAPEARRAACESPFGARCAVHVSGQRMLLFLRRGPDGQWRSAERHGIEHTAVAWVEAGRVYAIQQHMNPGPAVLSLVGTEADVARQVAAAGARRDDRARILAVADPGRRASGLAAQLRDSSDDTDWIANESLLDDLAGVGAPAVPALRAALREPRLARLRDRLVTVLARAGGPSAAADMLAIVTEETAFWRARAPQLPVGWWNFTGISQADVMPLRDRYGVLLAALRALAAAPTASARAPVTALRDLWRGLPQLEDRSGLDQMSRTCDEVLAALPRS